MKIRICAPSIFEAALRWLSQGLIWGGVCGLLIFFWSESDRRLYQAVQSSEFESMQPPEVQQVVEAVTQDAAPAPVAPSRMPWLGVLKPDPHVVGRLEIPRLNLNVIVRKGIDEVTLRRSVGHMPGTALPGASGNAILVGHRDGLFRPLRHIERGDLIRMTTAEGRISYQVNGLSIVGPDAVEVLQQGDDERVTLITCYPFDYIGAAPRRLIVSATRRD